MGEATRGIVGVIRRQEGEDEYELTLVALPARRRVAVVVGSESYIARALFAAGLTSPIRPLAKHRDRSGAAFVGRKPANGRP